jgi:hypothetical protein
MNCSASLAWSSTMASRVWSSDDLQVLQHAANDDWRNALSNLFPDRTQHAIKTRLSKLRSELGVKGRRGAREKTQEIMNAEAIPASQRLLEATLRVGRWS